MYQQVILQLSRRIWSNITQMRKYKSPKASPSFEREYNLKYLGKIGNVFPQTAIDKAIELGDKLESLPINPYTHHFAGYRSRILKVTPLYIGELDKEKKIVRIIYCELFDNHATPEQVANRVHDIHKEYINLKWYIDGSNRGFINQLKTKFNESLVLE